MISMLLAVLAVVVLLVVAATGAGLAVVFHLSRRDRP